MTAPASVANATDALVCKAPSHFVASEAVTQISLNGYDFEGEVLLSPRPCAARELRASPGHRFTHVAIECMPDKDLSASNLLPWLAEPRQRPLLASPFADRAHSRITAYGPRPRCADR